ncbi:gluconeogenesis factor YvcK family protein [Rarobacter incanus]|uniref:Putative gluconeogenesis factor n=1 Tax=Rarobacter incanus TaxID=153494 RepID=A0A542SM66_9MICO|nr:gluconeogenesis factor YvcK family protein [Rarobacter incanus]TQK75724.1 putative cofD-like protein [Rarobacter incanus]
MGPIRTNSPATGAIPVASAAIPDPTPRHVDTRPSVVAFGGGHGLAATLGALRLVTDRISAVVTVADDGGSSGRLREEFGELPPGDLRMALSALCDDSEWGQTWRDVLQYRFDSDGPLNQHAVGNLLILALWELLGDNVEGLDWIARLLGARGRVLPMAAVPLEIRAHVESDGKSHIVVGQSNVALASGRITQIGLTPEDPAVPDEVLDAVASADWLVFGPGSWFSSVMPHFIVPKLREAIIASPAHRLLTANIGMLDDESFGMTPVDQLDALHAHAPDVRFDAVLVDTTQYTSPRLMRSAAARLGARIVVNDLRRSDGSPRHARLRLAAAYRDIFGVEDAD